MRTFLAVAGLAVATAAAARVEEIKMAFLYRLPNDPETTITGVLVTSRGATGERSISKLAAPVHTSCQMDRPVYIAPGRLLRTGVSEHLLCENTRKTEPASLLAIFVAPDARS